MPALPPNMAPGAPGNPFGGGSAYGAGSGTILGPDSKPFPKDLLGQKIAPAGVNTDRYQNVYGSGLTPQVASSAVQIANYGMLYLLADILDECRETDPHLQSILSKRESAVAGAPWSIAPEDPSDLEQKKIAAWAENELRGIRNLSHVFARMQSAVYHGRYVFEQVWIDVGGALRLSSIDWLHPRRFGYGYYDWDLHLWDQTGNEKAPNLAVYPGVPLRLFPAGKFLVHEPYVHGGYPQREGLGRTCMWFSMFKRWDVRDLLALLEWAGRGIRIGSYATGSDEKNPTARASQEDVDVLEQAMMAMGSSLQIVIPDTVKIAIHELQATENLAHIKFADWCDSQNSKAVLGGTLTTDAGNKGARSLGDTQKEEQEMLARQDANAIAQSFWQDTLAPMVRYRWGMGATTRIKLVHHLERKADPTVFTGWLKDYVLSGGKVSCDWANQQLDIPVPKDGDEIMVATHSKPVVVPQTNIAREGDGLVSPDMTPGGANETGAIA